MPNLKKVWESMFVKAITGLIIVVLGWLSYNFYQNPFVDFPLKVEVLDADTQKGIENAEIFVQDTKYQFNTDKEGVGQMTIRVRKKEHYIILTCTSNFHETQEKRIDVPAVKGSLPEFYTAFVLTPKDL